MQMSAGSTSASHAQDRGIWFRHSRDMVSSLEGYGFVTLWWLAIVTLWWLEDLLWWLAVGYSQLIYLHAAFEIFPKSFENVCAVCFEIQVSSM